MTSLSNKTSTKRRLLLASDRSEQSSELASILRSVGQVDTIATSDIPDAPERDLAGIVVDINLRSAESVQLVRNKLRAEAYREMPRLFVLADALHHGSMQAWALGATDTIARPFDAQGILQRIRAAFPDSDGFDETDRGKVLNRGVEAAHAVMVKIFEKLPAGVPLKFSDIVEAENKILKAIRHSSLREWLTTVGCHHAGSYRHCLFVTGFAVAYAQHLGMRDDDQRRLARAALLHDVGKAFIPVAILDKPGPLTLEEMEEMRQHPPGGVRVLLSLSVIPGREANLRCAIAHRGISRFSGAQLRTIVQRCALLRNDGTGASRSTQGSDLAMVRGIAAAVEIDCARRRGQDDAGLFC